jgi:hypothetical protein
MTVEVDSERADTEKVGELAAADAAYTFNEMDISDEAIVNECVCTQFLQNALCTQSTRCPWMHLRTLVFAAEVSARATVLRVVVMLRPILSDQARRGPRRPQNPVKVKRLTQHPPVVATTKAMTTAAMMRMMSHTTKMLHERSEANQNESVNGRSWMKVALMMMAAIPMTVTKVTTAMTAMTATLAIAEMPVKRQQQSKMVVTWRWTMNPMLTWTMVHLWPLRHQVLRMRKR